MCQVPPPQRAVRRTTTWCTWASSRWAAPESYSARRRRSRSAGASRITAQASTRCARPAATGASTIFCAATARYRRSRSATAGARARARRRGMDTARSRRRTRGTAMRRGRRYRRARVPASEQAPVPHALERGEIREVVEQLARGGAARARRGLRHRRSARGARLPHPPVPLAAREPPRRCVRRRPRGPHAAVPGDRRGGARGVAGRPARLHARLGGGRVNGRWSVEDTVALARAAKARGVDVVTTSSGGIAGPGTATPVPRVPAITCRTPSACGAKRA